MGGMGAALKRMGGMDGKFARTFLYRFVLNAGFLEPAAGGFFLGFKVQNGKSIRFFQDS